MHAPKLDAPILLAHGMLGLAQALVKGLRLADYFRGIPDWMRAAGNEVLTPEVPGIGAITRRAEALKVALEQWTSEPVHVIAHSQGGLDVRHMITHLGMSKRVRSLATIGTPHRGSPVADWGVAQAESKGVFRLLTLSPMDTQAFLDLRTTECAAFNDATPDSPDVRYFSVAGDSSRANTLAPLRWCHDIVCEHEGANDGLVSVASAHWGEDCDVWPADHGAEIGWFAGDTFDWRPAYARLLRRLAVT